MARVKCQAKGCKFERDGSEVKVLEAGWNHAVAYGGDHWCLLYGSDNKPYKKIIPRDEVNCDLVTLEQRS